MAGGVEAGGASVSGEKAQSIAIVGAGSSNFAPALLHDLLTNLFPAGGELRLIDTNGEALALVDSAARLMAERLQRPVTVRSATDRDELLGGVDFVLITAEKDRINRWKIDWEIPRRMGIAHTLGENRGPAGLSHTLRTAPLVLDICRDVERLAPRTTVIILTNPEDRLAYAVSTRTRLRVYGYCDGLWDFKDHFVGPLLELPGDRLHVQAAGINHAVWITDIRDRVTGEDLYPRIVRLSREKDWQPFGRHLYEFYGLWPHENDEHYGEYFPYACEFIECRGYDFDAHVAMDREWKTKLASLAHGGYEIDRFIEETSGFVRHTFGDSPPSDVIRGIHAGRPVYLQNANIPNNGSISDLPDRMIVEIPAVASVSGFSGLRIGRLPDPVMVFLHREGVIQGLSAEAAVEGSRHKALQALLLDPQVRGATMAENLLDAFLDAHGDFIPPELWKGLKGR